MFKLFNFSIWQMCMTHPTIKNTAASHAKSIILISFIISYKTPKSYYT